MKKINMVDLKSQYNKIQNEIDTEVLKVIRSTAYVNGPIVNEFAADLAKYVGVKHVVPCANGTDSLLASLMAFDLQPGDEVITSTFTFIATAEVICLLGLTPVLVDILPDTFNLNYKEVEKAITKNTKAIIPVHLFGQCADMEPILEIAKKHNLYVIEDACQAIGSKYTFSDGTIKQAGNMGDTAGISFFPSKNLGCYGDGGAIFTNNDDLYKKLKVIVNHGMTERYYHDYIGINSRLDSIQAAILNVKLKYLDEYNLARKKVAEKYNNSFSNCKNITIPYISKNSTHVFHQYSILLENVDINKLQKELNSKCIPTGIYYPVPIHKQKAYKNKFHTNLPISEEICKKIISLPIHTEMDDEQINYITSNVLEFCENN